MAKFGKKGKKAAPAINTSSLPDIVFMLLFFFMVATTTKDIDPMVKVNNAKADGLTDLTPFKQRNEVDFLYLGKPLPKMKIPKGVNSDVVIQFDDILNDMTNLKKWKDNKYSSKPAESTAPKENVITCFKTDEKVPVKYLFDARKILQENDYNAIAYAAAERGNGRSYTIDND